MVNASTPPVTYELTREFIRRGGPSKPKFCLRSARKGALPLNAERTAGLSSRQSLETLDACNALFSCADDRWQWPAPLRRKRGRLRSLRLRGGIASRWTSGWRGKPLSNARRTKRKPLRAFGTLRHLRRRLSRRFRGNREEARRRRRHRCDVATRAPSVASRDHGWQTPAMCFALP